MIFYIKSFTNSRFCSIGFSPLHYNENPRADKTHGTGHQALSYVFPGGRSSFRHLSQRRCRLCVSTPSDGLHCKEGRSTETSRTLPVLHQPPTRIAPKCHEGRHRNYNKPSFFIYGTPPPSCSLFQRISLGCVVGHLLYV